MSTKQDAYKYKQDFFSIVIALALIVTAGQITAEELKPVLVNDAPELNRDANLLVNGSFEEGHPGVVVNPPGSPPNAVYWALVKNSDPDDPTPGYHNPRGLGPLSKFPDAELTPEEWTGEGGEANYAIWSETYIPAGAPPEFGPVGPGISTAPSNGLYSLYFGNYYIESIDVPQDRITIEDDGEWIFKDNTGARIDPIIVPGQTIVNAGVPASGFRPEVMLSQTVTDNTCPGATYRLSFTVFGEQGHPSWINSGLPLSADGFFGLQISGYNLLYLNVPSGSGWDALGGQSPFYDPAKDPQPPAEHTYTVEFVANDDDINITVINWGHFNSVTKLGEMGYQKPSGTTQTTELVLDDVILNRVNCPGCDLLLSKSCRIDPPPVSFDKCDGRLQQFTLTWNGANPIENINVVNGAGASATSVSPGDEVTVFGPFTDNNVLLTFSGGEYGQSEFHVSCSDDDFNSPDDCGKHAGDGKDNDSNLDNTWLLEGFIDDNGDILDCNTGGGPLNTICEFNAIPADCDNPDKPENLTWLYSGGGCAASNNGQGSSGDLFCEEFSGGIDDSLPVTITDDDGNVFEVEPGGVFTTTRSDSKVFTLVNAGGTEENGRHVSCSQPLQAGDVHGSLTLVGLDGLGLGSNVTYSYLVSNEGTDPITDLIVTDDQLGDIGIIDSLQPGESETLTVEAFISETTTNVAMAEGDGAFGAMCMAESNPVLIEVLPPPPCDVGIEFDKLEDDKIKWKLSNNSVFGKVTLQAFTLDFPAGLDAIEKVKLDGDIYKADDSNRAMGPGAMIAKNGWTQSDISKRQLELDETRTLQVEFTDKLDEDNWLGMMNNIGGVTFSEGCEVEFPAIPFCEIDKPTALVFEYTGENCSATTNNQEDKVECSGDPMLQTPVTIVMTKDKNKFTVIPAGGLGLNQTFKIERTDDPGKELEFPSEIEFDIRSGGQVLQSLKIHTSCSKDLKIGDQFGGVILREFDPAN